MSKLEEEADYSWKPKGVRIYEQAVVGEPLRAFKLYVLPGLSDPNWLEDSREVNDTHLRKREWAGLVMHSIALEDLTGTHMLIGPDMAGGDGVLFRQRGKSKEGVFVEQTLATHKAHNDLTEAVAKRVSAKSSRGQNYSDNKHLVVWCNIEGAIDESELGAIVAASNYNIVNIIGFNSATRHYLCYVFDRERMPGPVHRCAISEEKLIKAAMAVPDIKPGEGQPR